MKKIIPVIVLCLALASCAKESSGGTEPSVQDVSTSAAQETEVLSDLENETETEIEKQSTAEAEAPSPAVDRQETKVTQKSVKPTQEEREARTEASPKTTAAPEPTVVKGFEREMLELCNQQRRANGKNDFVLNNTLCENAAVRAEEISRKNCFSHTRPDGTMCFTAVTVNYMTCGENIAYGTRSASATVTAWMNSPGHKENILSENFTEAGFGCYEVNGVRYWVQLFIG